MMPLYRIQIFLLKFLKMDIQGQIYFKVLIYTLQTWTNKIKKYVIKHNFLWKIYHHIYMTICRLWQVADGLDTNIKVGVGAGSTECRINFAKLFNFNYFALVWLLFLLLGLIFAWYSFVFVKPNTNKYFNYFHLFLRTNTSIHLVFVLVTKRGSKFGIRPCLL